MNSSNLALKFAALTARLLPPRVKLALYRSPRLAGLIRGSLNRAAPQELTAIRVAAGGLTGMSMILNLQNEKDYWLGTYEAELQQAVRDWVRPGFTAYDVGANIGYITLLLSMAVGEEGRVFAFEALPANVERLKKNLNLNHLQDRVNVISAAVVDRSGPARFLTGPSNGTGKAQGSAGRLEDWYGQVLEIDGLSLDEFVFEQNKPPPDIVKIDIEGGEVLALPGMVRIFMEIAPLVFLELHGPESARSAWEVLTSCKYEICRMYPGYPTVKSVKDLDWKAYLVGIPPRAG